jgi:hypothetical protein
MTLSEKRLDEAADQFHTVGQTQWRETGDVTITLVYLPENGEPTVQVLLGDQPPTAKQIARTARELKTQALILTGEGWAAPLPNAKALDLPPLDRPRPSEQSERYPVIVTIAVRADGLTVLRETRISTGAFGRTLTPGNLSDPGPRKHGLAALLREALTLAYRR